MNDSAEVQSPPSKRLKQALIGAFAQSGTIFFYLKDKLELIKNNN